MKKLLIIIPFLVLLTGQPLFAQSSAEAEKELTQLLHQFLKGASESDAQMHDRFWAEDLIYTSSSGERYGKAQIMAGFSETNDESAADEPATIYSAEEIQIQLYDDMAIVAFRLVGKTKTDGEVAADYYLNSGTFVQRNGQWKVVNWQATKVPEN